MNPTTIKNHRKYKIPNCTQTQHRPINAVYLNAGNDVNHELAKALGAYMIRRYNELRFTEKTKKLLKQLKEQVEKDMEGFPLQKGEFITEAIPIDRPKRRIDLVMLNPKNEIEFENDKKIRKEGAITITL